MATAAKKAPTTKKVTIYRNGDPSFRPVAYTFQPQKTKTFAKLLEEIDRVAPPLRGGGVRSIFTADGKEKIDTLEKFEAAQSAGFVACGTEPYKEVKGGYENIGKSKKDQAKPDAKKKSGEADKKEKDLEEPPPKREESFLEMNKKKYGDQPRSDDQKLENRVDVGVIKKIMIYRNGDQHYKPKQYIYKSKTMRNWEKYLEEMNKIAPPMKGGSIRHVYTMDGETEIVNFDDLEDGEGYVVGGIEGYQTLKNGYESVGKPEGSPRKQASEQPPKEKGQPRNSEEKLMNRRDQTHPEPAFYFVFKNGDGLQAKRFIFTPKQMDKGMPWLLEQVGKKFNVYAKKLVTMDNRDIFTVNDLENKGAYVVIPLGETFRDTWYYLPALAKDTSADAEEDGNGQQRNGNGQQKNGNGQQRGQERDEYGEGNRRRRNSDEGDYYDEEYDSRTESGQEYYSDEEGGGRRRDDRGEPMKHNHRPGSNTSYCSYCDMLERHRQKHHYYSDDEEARSPRSRPYTAESRYSPPRERSRSRAPTTADRRMQGTSNGRNAKPISRRRPYEEEEPYDDEFEDEDYRESPPPSQKKRQQSIQKNNTQLRRAKSEASMSSNKYQSRQSQQPGKTNSNVSKKKSNSAEQKPTNKPKNMQTTQNANKSPSKTATTPARSKSQQNLSRSQTNVNKTTANNKTNTANSKTQQNGKQWK